MQKRGKLRIYLGAAPGVGKTCAMLDEGCRRRERGRDVAIGYVEAHGRPKTISQIGDLPVVPRGRISHHGQTFEEMDVAAVIARRPEVALIDEMAHTNVPGSRNEKRWMDIEEVLEAGIEVITTLNIQHLTSLNDLVERITGAVQSETVPDGVVRRADGIDLVDMEPDALRRRMAHGNIYAPERSDAALANYFKAGNLSALRELALLWMADRVDEDLVGYRARHGIHEPWETKERIVVGLNGGRSGEHVVRRACRMATRVNGQVVGVHVHTDDGSEGRDPDGLAAQRKLLGDLDARYAEVTGPDVAHSLIEFARAENASQLVLGASRRTIVSRWLNGSVVSRVARTAGPIDLHVISTPADEPSQPLPVFPRRRRPAVVAPFRHHLALALATLGIVAVGLALSPLRESLRLSGALLCLLLAVGGIAALGGLVPGLTGTIIGALTADHLFVQPSDGFAIASPSDAVALTVFVVVAGLTTVLVDQLNRRRLELVRAHVEMSALARLAGGAVLSKAEPLPDLVGQLRRTFDLDGVAVLTPNGDEWLVTASSGEPAPARPENAPLTVELEQGAVLVLQGRALSAEDRQLLASFAAQLRQAQDRIRLQSEVASAAEVAEANDLRAALLAAVSHDLRTPLAGVKAAATSLLSKDVTWSPEQFADFCATINAETDTLTRLIEDLLAMSRVQAKNLPVLLRPVDLDEVVESAMLGLPRASDLIIDVDPSLPRVEADAGLLERALANIMANAQAWSPAVAPVRITAGAVAGHVELRVIDQGPGIPTDRRGDVFLPFQRLGDNNGNKPGGLGLGLAIAKGFVEAMGGDVSVDDTPGGGATLVVTLNTAGSRVSLPTLKDGASRRRLT